MKRLRHDILFFGKNIPILVAYDIQEVIIPILFLFFSVSDYVVVVLVLAEQVRRYNALLVACLIRKIQDECD